jgi:hypothetical protein
MVGHHARVIASRTGVVDVGEAADIPRTVAHWLRPARMTFSASAAFRAMCGDTPGRRLGIRRRVRCG